MHLTPQLAPGRSGYDMLQIQGLLEAAGFRLFTRGSGPQDLELVGTFASSHMCTRIGLRVAVSRDESLTSDRINCNCMLDSVCTIGLPCQSFLSMARPSRNGKQLRLQT